MTLEDLGYYPEINNYRKEKRLERFAVGRVISEHKEYDSEKRIKHSEKCLRITKRIILNSVICTNFCIFGTD